MTTLNHADNITDANRVMDLANRVAGAFATKGAYVEAVDCENYIAISKLPVSMFWPGDTFQVERVDWAGERIGDEHVGTFIECVSAVFGYRDLIKAVSA